MRAHISRGPELVLVAPASFASVPAAFAGTLAAHWQAAAFLDRGKPFRCRELIQASLTAALEKARTELKPQGRGEGVIVVAGSLHAAAAAAKHAGLL